MTRRAKPILHGRDHAPDGADPIPGLVLGGGGGGGGIEYETDNEGGWLDIGTTSTVPGSGLGSSSRWGTRLHADTTAGSANNYTVGIDSSGAGSFTTGLTVLVENTAAGSARGIEVVATGAATPTGVVASATNGICFYAVAVGGTGIQIDTNNNGLIVNLDSSSPGYGLYVAVSGTPVFAVAPDGKVYMRNTPVIGPF